MKKIRAVLLPLLAGAMVLISGCGGDKTASSDDTSGASAPVADANQMAKVQDVVEEGMVPVYGSSLKDGVYPVQVDSSSSMFQITRCDLTVSEGQMTAVMYMGGTGYLRVFMGSAEEAAAVEKNGCIPFEETADGIHTFTVPVEALDMGIPCAAFSKNKELWYDRTLVFRADSLPADAYEEGFFTTVQSLGLADGVYTVDVQLEGGSGRASVESPAKLQVEDGAASAVIIWGSGNYDYMKVGGEQFFPLSLAETENSAFFIPVSAFNAKITVLADTTAMSTPHEIEYTLYFDAESIQPAA